MTIELFIFILLIHFLADFGLQTHEQAINKYTSWKFLSYHVSVYSFVWFIASLIIMPVQHAFAMMFITFITHFLTDDITSKISKSFFDKKDYHNGFVVIGFDQMIHYITLIYTIKYLIPQP